MEFTQKGNDYQRVPYFIEPSSSQSTAFSRMLHPAWFQAIRAVFSDSADSAFSTATVWPNTSTSEPVMRARC